MPTLRKSLTRYGQDAFELIAPAGAILGDRAAEGADDQRIDPKPVCIRPGQIDIGQPGGVDRELKPVDLVRCIDADAHRVPVVDLGDHLHEIGNATAHRFPDWSRSVHSRRRSPSRAGNDSRHTVRHGNPDRARNLAPHRRCHMSASQISACSRSPSRERWRRKIFVLEIAVPQAAAAGITFDKPAVVEVETANGFARIDREIIVGEPRHQQ